MRSYWGGWISTYNTNTWLGNITEEVKEEEEKEEEEETFRYQQCHLYEQQLIRGSKRNSEHSWQLLLHGQSVYVFLQRSL